LRTAADIHSLIKQLPQEELWKFWEPIADIVKSQAELLAESKSFYQGTEGQCVLVLSPETSAHLEARLLHSGCVPLDELPQGSLIYDPEGVLEGQFVPRRYYRGCILPLLILIGPHLRRLAKMARKSRDVPARNNERDAEILQLRDQRQLSWGQIRKRLLGHSSWARMQDGRPITAAAIRQAYRAAKRKIARRQPPAAQLGA
jgi:hypothetical protein